MSTINIEKLIELFTHYDITQFMYTLQDYNYTLPEYLIAQTPADPPESCKFLVYDKKNGNIQDKIFSDITTLIDPNTLIIFNNSKVLKARLQFTPFTEEKQGELEIFYLTSINEYTFNALVRPGKKFKVGQTIHLNDEVSFHVDAITHEGRQLTANRPIFEILESYGKMPLPPYIEYQEEKADPYQPVFASKEGSVAAPTASLHFTHELIEELTQQGAQTAYTTLHVGLGTFKQVDTENIKNYDIHAETIEIDMSLFERIAAHKSEGKPILAVGTTVTRTLESLPYLRVLLQSSCTINGKSSSLGDLQSLCTGDLQSPYRNTLTQDISLDEAKTYISHVTILNSGTCSLKSTLFLYPGRPFYIIDQLITNFHLPKSSLLMLVAGHIGYDTMKDIYAHAIENTYRFYSFGDAMWIK